MTYSAPLTKAQSRWVMLGGVVIFLGIWEVAAKCGLLSTELMPPPSSIVPAFYAEVTRGLFFMYVGDSLEHYTIGVAVGTILGIALGLCAGLWPLVETAQEGIARLLRPIPPIAWIPFAIMWFGVTETSAAFIIAIGVLWLNYFATIAAVRSVDHGLIELARAFGQGELLKRVWKVILPGAASGIFSGIRAGIGMGWIAVLAAELFGIPGIGERMMEASGLLASNIVLLYMAVIAILYSLFDSAVVWISRSVVRWTP